MGKNTQIADLINYISVNGSGDIVMTGNIIMPGGSPAATQSYVSTAISNLVNAAPTALDTLAELSTALNNDASFATTVTNSLSGKLNLSGGILTGQLSGTSARFSGSQAYYAEVSADSGGGFLQAYNGSTLKYQPYLIYGGTNTTTFSLLTLNNAGATFSGTVVSAGLITGQNGIYQSNAASVIASNRYDTYNGGATQMQFNFPAAGSVAFNNGTNKFLITSNGDLYAANNAALFFGASALTYVAGGNTSMSVAVNGSTAITIDSNRNIGIGTGSPSYRLHIQDTGNTGTIAIGHNAYPALIYSSADSGEFRIDNRASSGAGYITFYPNGQAGSIGNEAMRILSTRHVLIGQTSASGTVNGIYFRPGIESGFIVTNDVALQLSRLGTTGDIQTFYTGSTRVGKIAVGSSTVTFESASNGGVSVFDSGNVTVGSISGNVYKFNVSGSVRSNRVIYNWFNGAWQGNGTYYHMKTNLYAGAAGNSQYTMSYFKGYSYSYSAHILEGGIGFHNWSGALYSTRTTGNLFTTAYVSSDGYVVLVIPSGSGESGVTLDWHQHWDYSFISAIVTNAGLHGSTTGKY